MAHRSAPPTSPNLMEFDDDSPRVHAPSVTAPASTGGASATSYFSDLRIHEPVVVPPAEQAPLPSASSASPVDAHATAVDGPEPERLKLHFFVACTGVEGHLVASSARTAQTFMRGALNMFAQTSLKTKSPRSKPATEVNVEVRVSREIPTGPSGAISSSSDNDNGDGSAPSMPSESSSNALSSESYWSERRKSRNPHFSVGFNIRCQSPAHFDRHVQIMVMIPDDSSSTNKNSAVFGYAQTSFQEMYTIATSGKFQQKMTLPVHSSVVDGATVVIRFADIHAQQHPLFHTQNNAFRSYLFYPLMREEQEQMQAAAAKLAIEEAAEVDFSVKIPLQLMTVCHFELKQMYEEWKARYNYNRKKNRHFDDDAEALNFGHDVYRVQVISGRNLTTGTSSSSDSLATSASRPSAFSIVAGRGGIMNRLKTQAGKWPGTGGTSGAAGESANAKSEFSSGGSINPFVTVKYSDGASGPHEFLVGKTNTEYDTSDPVWSLNKSATAKCPHGKPNTKMFVSAALPSRIDVSPVNSLKQFLFYRPSILQNKDHELTGWLRFEVYNESYTYMTGVENEIIGEILVPLQSVRDSMTVEQQIVADAGADEDEAGASSRQIVTSLTLVDWFDVRSPTSDEIFGQIQLRLNILLANPVESFESAESGNADNVAASTLVPGQPRTQRLASDCAPPMTTHPLENEMPLNFLYPHVVALQRHIAGVNDMIRLSESLLAQRKTFKSSQDKKRADVQSIPTNLHVSYFRIYRNFASLAGPSSSTAAGQPRLDEQASTEDLLGLGFSNVAKPNSPVPSATPLQASSQQRAVLPETHATITCGAPTAHAMGLSEYGLREMELEIHRLQGILDRCTPRIMTSNVRDNNSFLAEDITDYVFSSVPEELDDSEDDQLNETESTAGNSSDPDSSSPQNEVAKPAAPKKYNSMAARAVAGAKAAKKRLPATKKPPKPKDMQGTEDGTMVADAKYPPLRTEAEDGIDPTTSINYAVRVLCRLEMLRTEYYLRKSVAVSQSVSGLVTCFVTELDLCLQEKNIKVLEQMAKVGFLIGWESLISSHGKELRMLSDAWVAIKCLETFAFQLFESNLTDVVLEKREHIGYTICVPVPSAEFALLPESLRQGELITVTSVLFTQGINEMQSLANMVGHSGVSIQSKINSTSLRSIVEYYNRFTACGVATSETSVGSHPDEILRNLRVSVETESSSSKNTCILLHASDAVRSLHGGRVTYCKSGKDRTAMSATLEQARLVVQRKRHVLEEIEMGGATEYGPLEEVKNVANIMREFGVRMEIAKKNVGRYKYSFNSIQRKLLPEIYRPPMCTIQDIVTSVTARDS
uniref:C2 domain-containing protein n=1 Tax=Globisporangium ultimum (strain ATCC 200006 / CBS 805.95 / DAOM BR144) TaxID=431595 RepID=K3WWD9_GLOUD